MAMSPRKAVKKEEHISLKNPPLRLPGQSADERIRELEQEFDYLVTVGFCLSVLENTKVSGTICS